jgi:hypothetical protein
MYDAYEGPAYQDYKEEAKSPATPELATAAADLRAEGSA